MTQKSFENSEISFRLTGIDKTEHTFSLVPMKTKTAQHILHNILLTVIEPISAVLRDDINDSEMIKEIIQSLKSLDFDSFWFMAERVLAYSIVDNGVDNKKLEEATWYRKDPTLLYMAVYRGIKGNFPEVFQALGLEDLFRGKDPEKVAPEMSGDTPEKK